MYTKTILCLANSKKIGGSCVAGKEIDGTRFGPWIRPVSNRPTQEISELDRRYSAGGLAEIFDVIEIAFRCYVGARHQTENQLIASHPSWQKRGTGTWSQIQAARDAISGPLWLNGYSTMASRIKYKSRVWMEFRTP
jgi:hypothetical protein